MPWSSWRGRSPAEDVRMAAGLAEAGAGHRQELAVMWGRFLLVGCVWGRFLLVFCVCPKRNPRGGASRVWGWGDPGGLSGSERGGILLFQAIFAALGLCCLGGKGAGSGCCCCWQLLRSSAAAGFPWLPNPKPVELSVCTDRGKPCCEGSSLEGSRKIPVLLPVSVWSFLSFFFFLLL